MKTESVKLRVGRYLVPVTLFYRNKRIFIQSPYNKGLIEEVKSMAGAKWHGGEDPPIKQWSVSDCLRNEFQLKFLMGENVYANYDKPLIDVKYSLRNLYAHQKLMRAFGITRRYCIIAGEMGTGKSLAMIEIMEYLDHVDEDDYWYVGPVAGVRAVNLELDKWKSRVRPRMFTYNALVGIMQNWTEGKPAPKCVFFDESSKIKTPSSQRSQAALHLAGAVRSEWGGDGCVILMSGTPAPKNPCDWWHQAEVCCPGFLRECDINKFKKRMCLVEERESIAGGVYPHLITWLDDEKKCAICGQYQEHANHVDSIIKPVITNAFSHASSQTVKSDAKPTTDYHNFKPSKNEVAYLHERLSGLVLRVAKKDCLDLPEKIYKTITVQPPPDFLRAAKQIEKSAKRTITALTLLREISDGFQYAFEDGDKIDCPLCSGAGVYNAPIAQDPMAPNADMPIAGMEQEPTICEKCGGNGFIFKQNRVTNHVGSPKDQIIKDMLDELDDVGRFLVWGAFAGTVDKLTQLCTSEGWLVLQIDGRGYNVFMPPGMAGPTPKADDLLKAMDRGHPLYEEYKTRYPRVAVVGNPEAGGMALTLTASPVNVFYSNPFNGEARMQAEDRNHRPGMDANKGCTIVDIICLKSDQHVLDNLRKKKKLQSLTLGEIFES
jgi:hypothetical protein